MLNGSPNAWLGNMMQAFNKGDIDAFNQLCIQHQEVRRETGVKKTRADVWKNAENPVRSSRLE